MVPEIVELKNIKIKAVKEIKLLGFIIDEKEDLVRNLVNFQRDNCKILLIWKTKLMYLVK